MKKVIIAIIAILAIVVCAGSIFAIWNSPNSENQNTNTQTTIGDFANEEPTNINVENLNVTVNENNATIDNSTASSQTETIDNSSENISKKDNKNNDNPNIVDEPIDDEYKGTALQNKFIIPDGEDPETYDYSLQGGINVYYRQK